MKRLALILFASAALASGLVFLTQTAASPGTIERVSVHSAGYQGNGHSQIPSTSANGRYVAFQSGASNLVEGDTNGTHDVFVHDRQTGQTTRVSVDSSGTEGNGGSGYPAISADGRYVAFSSASNNLVLGDSNAVGDVFVHDRQTAITTRVSIHSDGSEGNGWSQFPSISADGRYVAFMSPASNLVSNDTNGREDIFVHDRQAAVTERVSVDTSGDDGDGDSSEPAISADGRYVAFTSSSMDLVSGDTNGWADVFVRDRQTGATDRVSLDSNGQQANHVSENAAISSDGRHVAFHGRASNLVEGDTNGTYDVFVRDRQTGATDRVSVNTGGTEGNGGSQRPAISGDGRYVAYQSPASNLVSSDYNNVDDVFLHDRDTDGDGILDEPGTTATERVSVGSAGNEGNDGSLYPAISADGRYVAYYSYASNLVGGDTNGVIDVFVHDRGVLPTPTPTPTPTPAATVAPTATPTPPAAVGGIVELHVDSARPSARPADGSSPASPPHAAIAGIAATAIATLSAGAWYARRRWGR